jgi:hypothetical protein
MLRLVRLVQAADISSIALLSDPGFRRQSAADQAARMKPHWKNFDHMIPIATAEQLEQIDVESHGLALGLDLIIPW